jgi:hypothetical protein
VNRIAFRGIYCEKIDDNPNVEGGMRFTFPPYAKKIESVSSKNNKTTHRRGAPWRPRRDFSFSKNLVKPRWFWYKEWI